MHYDPLSSDVIANPYPTYAALRQTSPIFWHGPLESWVLTRYRDCAAVLRDSALFASDWRRAGFDATETANPSLQGLDPPEHNPVRRLFINAVHAQGLSDFGVRATDELGATFARLADAPSFDFNEEVARPITLRAVSRMLGVDPPDLASFSTLVDTVERGMDATLVPEALAPAQAARKELNALLETLFADVSRPGLLGQVVREGKALGLQEETVWSSARVLFLAGFSTTVSAAGNALLALLDRPETLARLRNEPSIRETAVDELLRFDSPIQGTSRACVQPVVIDGVEIARGQTVLLLFGAANRDPEQFADPDALILDRKPNRHLAFGAGPHACTGALLAKIILRALLDSLLELPNTPRLAGPVTRKVRATVRYPDCLPLTLH